MNFRSFYVFVSKNPEIEIDVTSGRFLLDDTPLFKLFGFNCWIKI
jgi:hypothetical protein